MTLLSVQSVIFQQFEVNFSSKHQNYSFVQLLCKYNINSSDYFRILESDGVCPMCSEHLESSMILPNVTVVPYLNGIDDGKIILK